jgi:hypothetical protein
VNRESPKSRIAYKYFAARYGLAVIRRCELKVTPPNELNDPFEFRPHVIRSLPEREAKRLLTDKRTIKEMYEDDRARGTFAGNFREYRKLIGNVKGKLILGIVDSLPQASQALQHRYPEAVSRAIGVLSLTARPDSIVMWGHYADKHRGIVIGFDKDWEMFRRGRGLSSVEYSRERLVWDASCKPGSAAERDYVSRMIKHKNHEWNYEAELREVFQLPGLNQRSLEDGSIGYFLPIPSSVILTVILGALCSTDTEVEVRAALRDGHLPSLRTLKRAKLHESRFAMDIVDAG